MVDFTLPLPGLSPVAGKEIVVRFDGGRLSSDGGLLVLREIEQRLKGNCSRGWHFSVFFACTNGANLTQRMSDSAGSIPP